nr:ribonuclease H-like domain-containing protein [Tanacetum cinerariifolium]
MAFMSFPSPNSTNEVPTDFGVSTASPQVSTANLSDVNVYDFLANQPNGSQLVHEDLKQNHEDDLEEMDLKWQLALLSMRAKRFFQKTGKKITINGSDTARYDKAKVECFNCHKMGHFAREWIVIRNQENKTRNQKTTRRTVNVEDASSKEMVAIDGASFDCSYMDDDEAYTNMAFMAFSDSERDRMVNETNHSRVNHSANIVPKAVLTRTGLKPVNSVRPVNPKRHITGNISYIIDFKEFDGGYVAFGGGAKGGKITSKGIIRTADESHVLLKVPRKNNMYRVDMKNIVPKKDLTCLIAKAINDESMLWYKRLGHINFKNINKLVKENLVRDFKLPTAFWVKALNTACYVQNRVLVVKPHLKTHYELFRGRTPIFSIMRPFGCHVTILNTLDHLGKFDGKSDEGFFVGYSTNSKAFRVYNTITRKVEENLHIKFLENKPIIVGDGPKRLFDIDALTKSINYVPVIANTNSNDYARKGASFDADSDGENKDNDGPCKESEIDNQERANTKNITKDVNTNGSSINTASLNINIASPTVNTVSQSDDFFGADKDMKSVDGVEMDGKIAFLYGRIKEEVYVCQPLGFKDPDYPNKVYKVEKALYGLQVKQKSDGIFISQDKYIDEILRKFKYTNVKPTSNLMDKEKALLKDLDGDDVDVHLYRSMIGSLMYLTLSRPDFMLVVCTGVKFQVNLKVSYLHAVKRIFRYLMGQPKLRLWYPRDSSFDLVAYSDSDYARASLDIKSTSGGYNCDKHNMVAFIKKLQGSEDFHQIVDFLKASHIRYALTENPTIYVSFINQFWCTGSVKTLDNGEKKLNATVDGQDKTITEASITRHLKLVDADGISTLPTTEIFDQLALMGIKEINEDENIKLVKISKQGEAHDTTEHKMESDDSEVVDFSTASPQKDDDEETFAETLVSIKKSAAKDKGKAIMQESEPSKKIKKKEMMQISLDEKIAQSDEARKARENTAQAEQWDDVQAQIQADKDLAKRMLKE